MQAAAGIELGLILETMPQLFTPGADAALRRLALVLVAFVFVITVAVWGGARTPAATGQFRTATQPIPFSHPLHVNGLHLDCLYCHAGAERSSYAGLPPTAACVPCHRDATIRSALFAPVRDSLSSGRPIPWRRVTSVPDFVFFNHAVHVRTGVACQTCHGPIESMPQVYQAAPLTMEWCLQCHRAPERYVRLTDTGISGWKHGDVQRGRAVQAQYDIERLTSCTTCHR